MPDFVSFLPLHQSQLRDIAASIDTGPELAVRVKPTQLDREIALQACKAAGVSVPAPGAFTIHELDAAAAKVFSPSDTLSVQKRLKFKAAVHAGGMLLEPIPVDKIAIVKAGLMLRKANIPAPTDKPYTVAEFDALMAGKGISIGHKLEIKQTCLAAGVINPGVVAKPSVAPQAISAPKMVCDGLGLDWPTNGKKLKVADVDDAIERRDWNRQRGINAKGLLATAGVL